MNTQQAKQDIEQVKGLMMVMAGVMKKHDTDIIQELGYLASLLSSTPDTLSTYYRIAVRFQNGHPDATPELVDSALAYTNYVDEIIAACAAYAASKLPDHPGDSWLLSLQVFSKFARQDSDARFALFRLLETM